MITRSQLFGSVSACMLWCLAGCDAVDVVATPKPQVPGAPDRALGKTDAGGDCSALFCSGFEEPLLAEHVQSERGRVVRSSTLSRTGHYSLEAQIDGMGAHAFLSVPIEPMVSGELFVQAHVFLPTETALMDFVLLHVGSTTGAQGVNVDLWEDDKVELYLPANRKSEFSAPGSLLRDEWMCLSLRVAVDDTQGEAEVNLRDQVLIAATGGDTLPPDGVTRVALGFTWSHESQLPATVYIDDVIIDRRPLVCP